MTIRDTHAGRPNFHSRGLGKLQDGQFQSARQHARSPFARFCRCGTILVLGDVMCTPCEMSQAGLR